MEQKKRRFAVLTGGGDCPGLNAVIRAVVKTFLQNDCEVYGVLNGFNGLINDNLKLMDYAAVSGILPRGGTILGTTNRDNPFHFAVEENGELVYKDMREKVIENLRKYDIEALVVIGGDGSLNIGAELARECDIKVVGVPKTIDNDLPCTERTFGFDTAMAMATEALDRLHTTAESHHRVMVLEVMGRYAGWIALHSGIAGGADIILLPELPYDIDRVCEAVERRAKKGSNFSILAVAEGAINTEEARMKRKDWMAKRAEAGLGTTATNRIAQAVQKKTGMETRVCIPGHMQRGGSPSAYDRVLATQFGSYAAQLVEVERYGVTVAMVNRRVTENRLADIAGKTRNVPENCELLSVARRMGVCLG